MEEEFNCEACEQPDSADVGMVSCDSCSKWYHYVCADESPGVKNRQWKCAKCVSATLPNTGTKKKTKKASLKVDGDVTNRKTPSGSRLLDSSEKAGSTHLLDIPNPSDPIPAKGKDATKTTSAEKRSIKSHASSARVRAQQALQRLEDERRLEEQS
ncbi:uncharacterized protein LOC128746178 [Sabethes cyaneus]|uniref:uncharacterized protein LOC128746178 n=1 Tax=Sabethes cyaneus TaxID=53552 RepID=UPI00237D5D68|nr:uncharacterized protein LOC128746178 [Sabethes cyaneus]